MPLFSMLKRNSKLALEGSWGRAILVLLIPSACAALLSALGAGANLLALGLREPARSRGLAGALLEVSLPSLAVVALLMALGLLLLAPLRLGVSYWFFCLVHGRSLPVRSVFRWYAGPRRYASAVGYAVHIAARSYFWALLFLLVPLTLTASSLRLLSVGESRTVMAFGTVGLSIAAVLTLLSEVLCTIFLGRYFLAAYLLCGEEEPSIRAAFRSSMEYTRGHCFSFFLYTLSFLGWLLLSVLTCGLAALFTAPYLAASCAMYGRYLIEQSHGESPDSTREFVM